MSKLTEAARGNECAIRLFPYCTGDTETTVFCHAPSESKGMGKKSEDWWGADGCFVCHAIVDGRKIVPDLSRYDILLNFFRGIHITIARRIRAGLIKI